MMLSKEKQFAGLIVCCSLLAPTTHAASWSDSFVGYRYGTHFTEPNNPNDIARHILQFSHVNSTASGLNFLNLDILRSDHNEPAKNSNQGATELYLTYRYQYFLSPHVATLQKADLMRDIALTAGFDANTKDTTFAPRKRLLVAGPTLKFKAPGFLDISLFYAKEWNHCGLPVCELPVNDDYIAFDPYLLVSAAWKINFPIASTAFKFQGFLNYATPKGEDYLHTKTAAETLLRTSLMADVGTIAWNIKNTFWAGVGYEYWHNKFGNHDKPGVTTRTPTLQLEWHF